MFKSTFYSVIDYKCNCDLKNTSCAEYQHDFTMSHVRKGNFIYHVFRNSLDAYNGWILFNKPGYVHTVTHHDGLPDECTTFKFTNEFYDSLKNEYDNVKNILFSNDEIHSLLIRAGAELEFLHHIIIQNISKQKESRLLIDSLVMEILYSALNLIHDNKNSVSSLNKSKRNHLVTIERAKQFINNNFHEDISLFDVAENSFVSPFHFSRTFKNITSYSPYQYLMNIRLKNAEVLLKTTDMPITQVCFSSGFQNLEHFSYAFKKKYQSAPSSLRK